jgi:hypothetical protein
MPKHTTIADKASIRGARRRRLAASASGRAAAAMAALLSVAACQSPPELDVERQWADSTRRLNFFGFYPMTEDVRVGNVYLHAPPRDSSASLSRFSLQRIGSFRRTDVLRALESQERDRIRIHPLPVRAQNRGSNAGGRLQPEALETIAACDERDFGHADSTGCRLRLQRSAIPALSVGRITAGQLGAAGLIGNVGARLGLGAASQTAVNISLLNVQEMTLDAWRAAQLYRDHGDDFASIARAEEMLAALGQLRGEMLPAACNGDQRQLARAGVEVLMVTRVIYAGGIEYGFTENAETAIRAALDLQSALPGQPQAPVIPTLPTASPAGRDNAGTPPAQVADTERAGQRLADLLKGITGESGSDGARAGVTTSFGMGTFGTLALKEEFNRPIAVGAGSRMRMAFHELLAGPVGATHDGRPLVEHRLRHATEYCARAMALQGQRFDAAALGATLRAFAAAEPGPR